MSSSRGKDELYSSVMMRDISSTLGRRALVIVTSALRAETHSTNSAQGVIGGCTAQVWASKWSERAWLSRRARGVKEADLYMAVLLQQVF